MKLLVVSDSSTIASALTRLLKDLGHSVKVCTDGAKALAHVESELTDCVVLESDGRLDIESALKTLHTSDDGSSVFSLAIMPADGKAIAGAFNAGADDVLRKAYTREELKARILGASRFAARIEIAVKKELNRRNPNPLSAAAAWQEVDLMSAHELSDMTGLQLTPSNDDQASQAPNIATITLSLPEAEIDIPIALQADTDSLNAFAETMLGGPVEDGTFISQLLLEATNTLAGAFKRKALAAGFEMVIGLPTELRPSMLPRLAESATDRRSFTIGNAAMGVKLRADVLVRKRGNQSVTVGELREGMVLARDLLNSSGVLMLGAGIRLTQASIRSVVGALGPEHRVQVSSAII